MPQLVEFGGQRHEFPDDFTDADIAKALSASGTPAPAPAAQPSVAAAPVQPGVTQPGVSTEPSLLDRVMSGAGTVGAYADRAARGIAKGAVGLATAPVDLLAATPQLADWAVPGAGKAFNMVNPAMRVATALQPYIGGEAAKNSLDKLNNVTYETINAATGANLTPPQPKAPTFGQRATERVFEEVGAAALPVIGSLAKAGQVGVEGARQLPTLARMFVEPAAVSPKRFILQEAGAATAAGTGAAGANAIVDPNTTAGKWADVAGALAGGFGAAGLQKAAGPVANTARAVMPGAKHNYSDPFVRNNVAETLGGAYGIPDQPGGMNVQPLIDAIERGNRPGAMVPGFKETLADRTANPGLASLEYSRQAGPNSGQFTTRRMENVEATDRAIQANAPTEATPGALRESLESNRNNQLERAGQWADINQRRADTLNQGLTPQTDAIDRGTALRNEIETARELARGETRDLYGNVDLNQQVDIRPLLDQLGAVDGGLGVVRQGLVPSGVIDRVRGLGNGVEGPVMAPLSTVDDLRSELLRFQRAAYADPRAERGGRNAAEATGRYADTVDEFLIRSLPPEQQKALIAARDARRAEADQFGRAGDPVAAAVARYEGGTPRMRDEQLPGSFAQRPEALDTLLSRVDTPDVRAAIRDELLARLQRSGATPEAAQAFTQQYSRQLGNFPGLEQEIQLAARARDEAGLANQLAEDFGRQFGRPGDERGTGTVGRYLKYDDAKAGEAMKTVLNSPRPVEAMDELLRFAGNDPKALEAARRQFWNVMEQRTRSGGETTKTVSGVQPWLPNAMKSFLEDPKFAGLAERLYRDNPEHLANVKQIAEALQGTDVRLRAKAANTSGTAQGTNPVLTPETLQSRIYSYRRGAIGGNFLITSIAAVTGRRAVGRAREAAVSRLLDEALLNPEAAALLLKENNPANRTALRRMGKAWLGNEVSTVVDMLDGPDDVTQAVGAKK